VIILRIKQTQHFLCNAETFLFSLIYLPDLTLTRLKVITQCSADNTENATFLFELPGKNSLNSFHFFL